MGHATEVREVAEIEVVAGVDAEAAVERASRGSGVALERLRQLRTAAFSRPRERLLLTLLMLRRLRPLVRRRLLRALLRSPSWTWTIGSSLLRPSVTTGSTPPSPTKDYRPVSAKGWILRGPALFIGTPSPQEGGFLARIGPHW